MYPCLEINETQLPIEGIIQEMNPEFVETPAIFILILIAILQPPPGKSKK